MASLLTQWLSNDVRPIKWAFISFALHMHAYIALDACIQVSIGQLAKKCKTVNFPYNTAVRYVNNLQEVYFILGVFFHQTKICHISHIKYIKELQYLLILRVTFGEILIFKYGAWNVFFITWNISYLLLMLFCSGTKSLGPLKFVECSSSDWMVEDNFTWQF